MEGDHRAANAREAFTSLLEFAPHAPLPALRFIKIPESSATPKPA
jgi:hypothetical protein